MSTSPISVPISINTKQAPWFRQVWLWFLLAPPIVAVVAGSYMVSIAFREQDAMVVDDYYREGQAINQDLQRDKVAAALKLNASIQYDAASGIIKGKLSSDQKISTGILTMKLVHPTQPSKDLAIKAQVDESGNFSLALPLLDKAAWQVTLEDQPKQWRLSGVWNWPLQQAIVLDPL